MKGVGLVLAPWVVSDDTPMVGAKARRRREPSGDEESRSQMRGTGRWMDVDLKTIDKVLAIISIIAFAIAIFYQPIMIESTILFIFWLGFDMYVSAKTSIMDFMIDVATIALLVLLAFTPNLPTTAIALLRLIMLFR